MRKFNLFNMLQNSRFSRRQQMQIAGLTAVLSATSCVCLSAYGLFEGYYSQLNAQPAEVKRVSEADLRQENKTTKPASSTKQVQSAQDKILANLKKQAENLVSDTNVFNILLIGSDQRGNVQGDRSDSCILVSINSAEKEITMTSFMRDCYVAIPGYDNNRLNASYALGGADLLLETIEYNFGIDINRYVQLGFDAFVDVVNALGGIVMDLEEGEVYYVNKYAEQKNGLSDANYQFKPITEEGKNKLDGMQALAYSRIRKIGSDFERTSRQRKVIDAAFSKLKKSDIVTLNDIFNKLLPKVHTDLTRGECISLLLDVADYKSYAIRSGRVPYDDSYTDMVVDGMQVLDLDFESNVHQLKHDLYKIDYEDIPSDEPAA